MKKSNGKPQRDVLSQIGADELAAEIRQFWQARGYAIEVVTEPMPGRHKRPIFTLKSSLVNGLPTRRSRIAA